MFLGAIKTEEKTIFESQSEDLGKSAYELELLKLAEICCCLLAFLGFCCGVLSTDLEHSALTHSSSFPTLMFAGSASTLCLLYSIYWRTWREIRWLQAKCFLSVHDDLLTSQKLNRMIVELIVNAPHPLYWLACKEFAYYNSVKDVEIRYTYNSWLTVWMLVRTYHLVKVVSALSPFRSGRAQRVCQMNGTYPGTWFSIKCIMRENPNHVLATMLMLGLLMGGFVLRVFERPMGQYTHMDYGDYGNSMWNVLVTMTTVGYGDLYPVTMLGRISEIFVCFWGVFSISLIIITVSSLLNFDSSEAKAYLILTRLEFKSEMRSIAARVITSGLKYRKMQRSLPSDSYQLDLCLGRFRWNIHEFQRARNRLISIYDKDSYSERVEQDIEEIEENIAEIQRGMKTFRETVAMALGV